jgi:uncharacterized protein involved in exopolysaccharide biosynthesis
MTEQTNPSNAATMADEDEISLLGLAIVLGEEKKTLFAVPAATSTLAILVSLLMTPIFTAKTVMMPPQQQQSGAASLIANMGGLAGLAGAAAGIKSPDEMYIALLQSDTLQNSLIEQLKLKDRYKKVTMMDTRKALTAAVKVTSDKKSGLISIEVDDKDPAFAAQLANAHVQGLSTMLGNLAVTDAQQRRKYFEQQLIKTQQLLSLAEADFRSAKEKSGMQVTAVIAEVGVKASAELRGQIAAREVQMQAMGRFATAQNPDMQRLGSELAAMRAQLSKIEQGTGDTDKISPTQQLAVSSYREIKAREAMMTVLMGQYESARLDEAKEGPLVQQVDVAQPPEMRSKPKRSLMVIFSAFFGLFVGVLAIFLRRAVRKAGEDPQSAEQMAQLKAVWGWKSK